MTKNKLFAWAITLLCFSLTSCSDEKDGPSEKILVDRKSTRLNSSHRT